MKHPARPPVSNRKAPRRAALALVVATVGLPFAPSLACGSFSASGSDSPGAGDASVSDTGTGVADALQTTDGSGLGPDAFAPKDGGGADAPLQEGCAADPLLDPMFVALPTSATCASDATFDRFCNLTMFGHTRSISFTTDERHAVVVPAAGEERAPFVIYARPTPSAPFAPVNGPTFPTTAYASFFRNSKLGDIRFELRGPNAGIGTIPVSLDPIITAGVPSSLSAPSLTRHLSHPYQLGNKIYAASYEDGANATLSLTLRSGNTWQTLVVDAEGSGAGSPVVNEEETELFFRAATPFRLFRAERNNNAWINAKAVKVPDSFGTVEGWQPQWLSQDGCRLYVTSVTDVPGVGVNAVRVLSRRSP